MWRPVGRICIKTTKIQKITITITILQEIQIIRKEKVVTIWKGIKLKLNKQCLIEEILAIVMVKEDTKIQDIKILIKTHLKIKLLLLLTKWQSIFQ